MLRRKLRELCAEKLCLSKATSDSILTPEHLRSPPVPVGANRLLQKTGFVSIMFADRAPRMERQRSVLSRRSEERLMGYRQVIQVAEGILQLRQRGDKFRAAGLRVTTKGLRKAFRRIAQRLCFDSGTVSRLGVEGMHVFSGLAQFPAESVERGAAER